jgi:Zn-dependent protease/CBS domain-containing protein
MAAPHRLPWAPWAATSANDTSSSEPRDRSPGPSGTRWSWRLGSLFGIDVFVHVTFVLLLVWLGVSHLVAGHDVAMLASGLLFVISIFAVVVFHELGHALTARRFGIRTRDITLLPIGGIARLERMPEKPSQELLVALAGPAVNVALALVLLAVLALLRGTVALEQVQTVGGPFLAKLLWINVSLAVFNLLPAFPMDGGRVLRAALALRMDHGRATHLAARIGQGMAVLFGVAGVYWNPMLILVAVFVWMGAREESASAQIQSALRGVPIGRAMITDFETLSVDDPLARAVDRSLAGFQHDFPVLDGDRLVGVLTRADLVRGLAVGGAGSAVREAMQHGFTTADPADMLDAVIGRLQAPDARAVVVLRDDRVVGLVTAEHIGELVLFDSLLRTQRGGTAS